MKFEQAKKGVSNDDNLIPMINVVFLLLVFFMVAGTLRPSDPLNVAPIESVQQQPLSLPVDLYMGVDGTLMLDGVVISTELLGAALTMKSDKLEANHAMQSLALKVDAQVSVAQLHTLLESLREVGVKEIELVTNVVLASGSIPSPRAAASSSSIVLP